MNVYFDQTGLVYTAETKRHHSHEKRCSVGSPLEAHQFVVEAFDVLVADYDEWLVREGHPGAGDG